MEIETLINFIKRRLAEDVGRTMIEEALLGAGYTSMEIEEAFEAISREQFPKSKMPEAGVLKEGTAHPLSEGAISPPKPKISFRKFSLKNFLLIALVLIAGASFCLYAKLAKPDPISLLPQETIFYFRIKINPEDQQVKNAKTLLEKFPNFEKISQETTEGFEKLKEENPPLKNLDFTISNEIILAFISPFEENSEGLPLVLILSNPDLKKLEKLARDIRESIEKSKDWKIEEETYKGRTIVKCVMTEESQYRAFLGEPRLEPSSTLVSGHLILATKPEDIKKIIDVAEDQKITNIFKRDKIKNITLNPAHRKIKKYFSKDYLILFYGESDWSEILKTVENIETIENTKDAFAPFVPSMVAAFNLPFFGTGKIEEPEKMAVASMMVVLENELRSETYYLDLGKEMLVPFQFSLKDSLTQFIPEKIGTRDIVYYGEGRNLKSSFESWEKILQEETTAEEKGAFDDFLKSLNDFLGVNFKEDIISLFEKNYAFFIASELTGEEIPRIGLLFEIDDENKAKENFLKIKIPREALGLLEGGFEGSYPRTKDARIMVDMMQLQMMAEIQYAEDWGYQNVSCAYGDIKILCDDIKDQAGSELVIRQSQKAYCAYVKLSEPAAYYCVDSSMKTITTYINPGGTGYCAGLTFVCPETEGMAPAPETLPEERLGFSKEMVEGFEIYSLPLYEEFGLNFSIREKKLVFAFTKEGLVEILEGLSDPAHKSLKDSEIFAGQFKEAPENVSLISYTYPYGFLGLIKYAVNFYVDLMSSFIPEMYLEGDVRSEMIIPPIFEFLDKGIAPYLKMLKVASSYSFVPEEGLIITKERLIIKELPAGEKKECEEFWANIEEWAEEKLAPLMLMPSLY